MKEIWKDIKDYEGYYQISTFGRVKSLDRIVKNGNCDMLIKGKILKQEVIKLNYRRIMLCKNNIKKRFFIHRLVATAFIPNPDNKPEVNHIDSTPSNNHVNNLEWCTHSENIKHSIKSGRFTNKKIIMLSLDNQILKKFESSKEAGKLIKTSHSHINECCNNKRNTAGGYKWKFDITV